MKPIFFSTPNRFRTWLQRNHRSKSERWIGFYKKSSGIRSISWEESVDQALCFGWIDGLRKSIDDKSYMIRFTPRRPTSNWSSVNLKRVPELIAEGSMTPSGLEIYENRKTDDPLRYAYEQGTIALPDEMERLLKQDPRAMQFFEALPPSAKKPTIWWLISAKQPATRARRLSVLIECCRNQQRIPQLRQPAKKSKSKTPALSQVRKKK